MATYATDRVVEGPFTASDPLDVLAEFYRDNGYDYAADTTSQVESAPDAEGSDGEVLVFQRGRESAGWWSSNMTELSTRVELARQGDAIEISYQVDVTGQHLTEEDRQFWRHEIAAAVDHLRHPSRSPRDLRHEESKRAERIRRRMLSYGIWGAILAFLLVVLLDMMASV